MFIERLTNKEVVKFINTIDKDIVITNIKRSQYKNYLIATDNNGNEFALTDFTCYHNGISYTKQLYHFMLEKFANEYKTAFLRNKILSDEPIDEFVKTSVLN